MSPLRIALAAAALTLSALAQDTPATPKPKLPADQQAYKTANAIPNLDQKIFALHQFIHDFPTSTRIDAANHAIFTALCAQPTPDEKQIRNQARLLIQSTKDDEARWNEENTLASTLANTGPNGVDLGDAEKWAKDMVKHQDEPTFLKSRLAMYAKYKTPAPKPAELHTQFAQNHANLLQTLADVYFHEGKQPETAATLNEAYALNPKDPGVLELRGRLALQQHRDADALENLQLADLYGGLKPYDEAPLHDLYRKAHGGSDATYAADMDARYLATFPPFAPARHTPVAGGHTALVELFTGSGCPPCVGMDLAVEGVLEAYSPQQVTVLAYDLHIPKPDPLANPGSVERGKFYDIKFTPTYLIDGHQFEPAGGERDDAERLYKPLARNLDAQFAKPSSVQLTLTAAPGPDHTIQTQATVALGPLAELNQQIAIIPTVVPDPNAKPAPKTEGKPDAKPEAKPDPKPEAKPDPKPEADADAAKPDTKPAEPKFLLNFALVEDDIRYTGENGVRFHRMVVRALAKPAAEGFPLTPGAATTLSASFDLTSISNALTDYLNAYEEHNERFGTAKFRSKDTTLNPAHLSIAAWVQDATTHRILQSAIIPLK